MPMEKEQNLFGTNKEGSKNEEYCIYCYKDGEFTADISMDEMIDFCVPHMVNGNAGMKEDEAKKMMQEFFPQLKRWKKD
jgi:hypothetical protein